MNAIRRRHLFFQVAFVIVPMVIGGSIYLLFRSDTLLMFQWVEALGGAPMIRELRGIAALFGLRLPEWVLYSLPNAIWVFSFVVMFGALWVAVSKRVAIVAMTLPAIVALGGEITQLTGIVPGQFDLIDLGFCFVATITGFTVVLKSNKEGGPHD